MEEEFESVTTTSWVEGPKGIEPDGTAYGPREAVHYSYQWGRRDLDARELSLTIFPAVITNGPPDKATENYMLEMESLDAARIYCANLPSARIVISLRVLDGEQDPLLRLERADYGGYVATLTYASKLTGVAFDDLAAPRDPNSSIIIEEPEPLTWQVRNLRKLRRKGLHVEAEAAMLRLRTDWKQRRDRNNGD